jgi:hypothetical protein
MTLIWLLTYGGINGRLFLSNMCFQIHSHTIDKIQFVLPKKQYKAKDNQIGKGSCRRNDVCFT